MNLQTVTTKVKAKYKLVKRLADGTITYDGPTFSNLITNAGIFFALDSQIISTNFFNRVAVGSSSQVPAVSDTSLFDEIAVTNNDRQFSTTLDPEAGVYRLTTRWQFPEGEAAGNISEIGVKTRATEDVLVSRALIKDAFGNPTTLTVLNNEFLEVFYYLEFEFVTADVPYSVGNYTGIIRACAIESTGARGWSATLPGTPNTTTVTSSTAIRTNLVTSSEIESINLVPSINNSNIYLADEINSLPYVFGEFYRDVEFVWSIDRGNLPEPIKTILFKLGPSYWQMSVNPPLEKNLTNELRLTVRNYFLRADE